MQTNGRCAEPVPVLRAPGERLRGRRKKAFIRAVMWNISGGRCHYCGAEMSFATFTLDHFIPRHAGGSGRLGNLLPACAACNDRKGDAIPLPARVTPDRADDAVAGIDAHPALEPRSSSTIGEETKALAGLPE